MPAMGPNVDSSVWGRVSRLLPQKLQDAAASWARFGEYGETIIEPLWLKSARLAKEQSYFTVGNPTPGTGLATIAALTAVVDTSPFLIITNNNPVGGPSVELDYLKLICTAPGTAGTALNWASKLDSIPRYASAGSVLAGAASANPGASSPNSAGVGDTSVAVYAGALVAVAASLAGSRVLSRGVFRTAIPVIGDQFLLNFGGHEFTSVGLAKNGTAPSDFTHHHAPVSIAPGGSFLLHLWLPSQSAASSFEVEAGYVKR